MRQTRKNNQTPYIVHPASVAQLVSLYGGSPYTLGVVSAWYHDVLEDCGESGKEIFKQSLAHTGLSLQDQMQVQSAVEALTKNDNIHPRSRKLEDAMDRVLSNDTPQFTILVKICDRIDNLMDMDGFKPGFRALYLEETDYMIRRFEENRSTHIFGYDTPTTNALADLVSIRSSL